jgi:hypothetical protein
MHILETVKTMFWNFFIIYENNQYIFKNLYNAFSNMLRFRIRILDCYTDPLGWKDKTRKSGNANVLSDQISLATSSYKSVKDMDKLFLAITELGRGIVFCYVVNCDIFRLRNIFVLQVVFMF